MYEIITKNWCSQSGIFFWGGGSEFDAFFIFGFIEINVKWSVVGVSNHRMTGLFGCTLDTNVNHTSYCEYCSNAQQK